jgi:hypothetical protein
LSKQNFSFAIKNSVGDAVNVLCRFLSYCAVDAVCLFFFGSLPLVQAVGPEG